jgi:hypothetical protein
MAKLHPFLWLIELRKHVVSWTTFLFNLTRREFSKLRSVFEERCCLNISPAQLNNLSQAVLAGTGVFTQKVTAFLTANVTSYRFVLFLIFVTSYSYKLRSEKSS